MFEDDPEKIERLAAGNMIVDTLLWYRSAVSANQWPFSDTPIDPDMNLEFYSNDGTSCIQVWYGDNAVRFSHNGEMGYGGIAGIGQVENPLEKGGRTRFIVLDQEGENIYSPGKLRSFGDNVVIIGENDTDFFVQACTGWYIKKAALWDITVDDIFTSEVQTLLIDLVNEGIFRI